MHKYKFYYLRDKSKETIYVFDAPNIEEAYVIASQIKQLSVEEFKKIFGVAKSK
tara:strand:- start:726 stop:887 length:162 start_codon:yes stop_codon:yes gene_type:complete